MEVGRPLDGLGARRSAAGTGHRSKLLRSQPHASRCRHRARSSDPARARRAVDLGRGGLRDQRCGLDSIVRRERVPGAHRGGGEGLRAGGRGRPEGCATTRAERRARRRSRARGVGGCRGRGRRSRARRHPRRLRRRRAQRRARAGRGPARARARPRLAVVPPQRPGRLGERADRDRPRAARAELRAGLGLCDRLARSRRRRRDDPSRRRRRRPRRRHRVLHAPGHPRRLLRDERARRGRGRPDACLAPLRRHARRLRDGRGGVRPSARGSRPGGRPRRARVRGGARVRDLERRAPHGAARPRVGRRRGDDAGGA